MTGETLTCPYCNASLTAPAVYSVGRSIVCPRCGDSFPWRSSDTLTNQQPAMREMVFADQSTTEPLATVSIPDASHSVRRSNRLVASLVIVLMLFMAGGGLTFMLITQSQRRAQDTSRPERWPGKQRAVPELDEPPVVASIAPDKWEALGYLPSEVNLLAGVRVAELLDNPIGVRVLRDPLKVSGGERSLSDLPAWVGLRLEDLDHLVFGVRLEDALIPPFYLVLRTARPYDEDRLRQRLKATRTTSIRKKNLYAFHTLRQDVPMAVWFADERTIVLALFADQLESLPNRPGAGLQRFSKEIRTVLKERLEPAAPIWIVGNSPDWSKTSAAKFPTRLTQDDWLKLSALRTFGIWFVPNRALEVKGVFACTNEAGTGGLDDYFRALHGPDTDFKTAREGLWLTLQFQPGSDFLARWMKH